MEVTVPTVRVAAMIVVLGLSACVTGPAHGRRASFTPSWEGVRRAAITAATDPQTWAPLAGAALVHVGDADRAISDWARDKTPLFGGNGTAEAVSDVLLGLSTVAWGASLARLPSGCGQFGCGVRAKITEAAIEAGALAAQGYLVHELKYATARQRPNGGSRDSFPSGHTYSVAAFGALTRGHAKWTPMSRWERNVIDVSTTAATALTGWARIEGERHYPSDVLVGWGLANFVNVFLHEAFIGGPHVHTRVTPDGIGIGMRLDL